MLRYYIQRSPGEEFEEVKRPRGDFVLVCAEHASAEDITQLAEEYSLNANILTDVRDAAELPRIEFSNGLEYIFLRTPTMSKKGSIITKPFVTVIGQDTFVTLFHSTIALPVVATSTGLATQRYTSLLLGTIASLIGSYESLIQHTYASIQDTGNRLRTHEVTNGDFIHFVTVEQNLNEYHMNLDGMESVMQRLHENKHELFTDDELEAMADISLHVKQLVVTVDSSARRVESIRNAYSTIANNNLNRRMKTLTVLTLLVAIPNLFYAMFGTNVNLPFADQSWAFGTLVGFTAALTIGIYLLAKRRKLF